MPMYIGKGSISSGCLARGGLQERDFATEGMRTSKEKRVLELNEFLESPISFDLQQIQLRFDEL